jgi:streptogramin lyase
VVRQDDARLTRLDPAGKVLGHTPLPGTPRLVAVGPRHVWVTDYENGTLTRVDRDGGRPRTSDTICAGAQGVAATEAVVWVTCTRADEVVAVDANSLAVRQRWAVPGEPDGIRLVDGAVWVAATKGPTLVKIDPSRSEPERGDVLGAVGPLADQANIDVVAAGGRLCVSSFREDVVICGPAT